MKRALTPKCTLASTHTLRPVSSLPVHHIPPVFCSKKIYGREYCAHVFTNNFPTLIVTICKTTKPCIWNGRSTYGKGVAHQSSRGTGNGRFVVFTRVQAANTVKHPNGEVFYVKPDYLMKSNHNPLSHAIIASNCHFAVAFIVERIC
jgi:hypothetical protein